jgi:hypothetical protein
MRAVQWPTATSLCEHCLELDGEGQAKSEHIKGQTRIDMDRGLLVVVPAPGRGAGRSGNPDAKARVSAQVITVTAALYEGWADHGVASGSNSSVDSVATSASTDPPITKALPSGRRTATCEARGWSISGPAVQVPACGS